MLVYYMHGKEKIESKTVLLTFQIWTSLDSEDYLSASRLFLLSQHINTSLQLDTQHTPNFLYWFPVLNRQWAAISHFKLTILQGCRKMLKEPSASDQVLVFYPYSQDTLN